MSHERLSTFSLRGLGSLGGLVLLGLAALATPGHAQEQGTPPADSPAAARGAGSHLAPPYSGALYDLGLSIGNKSVWATFRAPTTWGHLRVEAFGNLENEFLGSVHLMRFGRPDPTLPLDVGLGMGLYTGFLDDPSEEVVALALAASASWELATRVPSNVGAQVSFAPDILSWVDGESLLDFALRYELSFSEAASLQVGWRYFDIDTDDEDDRDLDAGFFVGILVGL